MTGRERVARSRPPFSATGFTRAAGPPIVRAAFHERRESVSAMRAEFANLVDEIEQSIALLRRHL